MDQGKIEIPFSRWSIFRRRGDILCFTRMFELTKCNVQDETPTRARDAYAASFQPGGAGAVTCGCYAGDLLTSASP